MAEELAGRETPDTGEAAEAAETTITEAPEAEASATETPAETPEAETEETPSDTETEADEGEESKGAPETYEEFKLPEGFVADEKATKEFTDLARELDLNQAQSQKLVDMFAAKQAADNESRFEARLKYLSDLRDGWAKERDELWGDERGKKDALAQVAIKGADKSFLDLLQGRDPNFQGVYILDHPAVAKYLADIGSKMGEKPLADGRPAQSKGSPESILYKGTDVNKP